MEDLYEQDEKILMLNKISYCSWPILPESVEKSLKVNGDKSIEFRSIDNLTTITLLDNGVVFEIEYPQMLPKKKPMWVNKVLYEDKYEDNYNFTKDFLSNLDLGAKAAKKERNIMKMGYEYIRMKKVFSIFDFPIEWSYALLVVFDKYENVLSQSGHTVKYRPNFSVQFLSWFENLASQPCSYDMDECGIFGMMKATDDIIMNEIPATNGGRDSSEDKENIKMINRKDIWNNDSINPLADFYQRELIPKHQINEEYVLWLTNFDEIFVWIQADNSMLISSQNGKYFSHIYRNVSNVLQQEESYDSFELKFSHDTVPPMIRSKKKTGISYDLANVVKKAHSMVNKASWNKELSQKTVTLNSLTSQKSNEEDICKMMPFDVIHQAKNEYGLFEAFKNKSIKIVFMDRTILRINFGQDFATILTKLGDTVKVRLDMPNEFSYYVNIALEYFEHVFSDPATKIQRINESIIMSEMINHELEKNERFLKITGKPNTSSIESTNINPNNVSNLARSQFIEETSSFVNQSMISHPISEEYFDIDDLNKKIQE